MGKFLKEYWLWIVAPIVLVFGLLIAVMVLDSLTGDDDDTDQPFIYNIW